MSPGLANAILAFAKGTDPPLKGEKESTDAFQTRTIVWLKGEHKSLRGLMWIVIAMHLAQWMGPSVGY